MTVHSGVDVFHVSILRDGKRWSHRPANTLTPDGLPLYAFRCLGATSGGPHRTWVLHGALSDPELPALSCEEQRSLRRALNRALVREFRLRVSPFTIDKIG